MQLEVRSLNVTWRCDLWDHRVIVFWKCATLLAEQLWQIWRRYAPPFFRYLRKSAGGGCTNPDMHIHNAYSRTLLHEWYQHWLAL